MGDALRRRVLLYLGLGRVWVELEQLNTRLKRIEGDVYAKPPRPAPAPVPTAWQVELDTGVRDRDVSTSPEVPFSRTHQSSRKPGGAA